MRAARFRHRASALAIAIGMIGGTGVAIAATRNTASPPGESSPYRLTILDATSSEVAAWGLHTVRVRTNLPDGTLLYVEEDTAGSRGRGINRVENGSIELQPNNNACTVKNRRLVGTVVRVRITAAPRYDTSGFRCGFSGCTDLERQPSSVEEVLGPAFEFVAGPQLVDDAEGRRLVASRTIRLPSATCFGHRISPRLVPYPRGAFTTCPDLEGTLPVSRELRHEAMEAAGRTDGSAAGSHSGKDDPVLVFGCGRGVAVRTWVVRVGDGLAYLVRRPSGWHIWARRG